ncbi:MAG: methyl-accepting chemotaxis sensory transducer, partial [Pseudomonas sp.]|nr:methyl-accepting chemotaxis sensory transducer [Pseudomonas sp.]
MLRALSRLCADLPVARKLAVGFTLVLILTLLVAASGFYAVNSVVQRYAQSAQLAQINSHILHARQAEEGLELKGNAQAIQEVRTRLSQVLELLGTMIALTPINEQGALLTMQQAAAGYLQQFEDFTQQQDKARVAQRVMTEAANEAASQFGEIEMDIYNAARDPGMTERVLLGGDPLVIAQSGSRLSKRMLELRASESAYRSDSSEQTLAQWQDSNEELKTEARNLTHWLDGSHKQDVLVALQALEQYQQGFEGYQQASAASQASESAMVHQAERVVELATQGQRHEE